METQYTLLRLFADGGWMMYPLLLCSLIGLGVVLAKGWALWHAHAGSRQLLHSVTEAARAGRLDEALEIASRGHGPAAAVLVAGLRRIRSGSIAEGELEQAVATTSAIELGFLERGLVVLATVAHVAPLLGFLGTVAGMIIAFGAIQVAGDVEPALVAGGIKVALLTTAAGLIIAIPANVAHNFFVTRIDQLIVDMDEGARAVLSLAWDLERRGGDHDSQAPETAEESEGPVLSRRRRRVAGEIPVASTADIAFLLLIFFLVSTTFPKDKGLAVVLPAPSERVEVNERDILHLAVRADGIVEVRRGESRQVQEVRPRDVAGVWRQEVASNPNLVAAIRTHPQAPYRYMVDVLDALESANAGRISLQVLETEP